MKLIFTKQDLAEGMKVVSSAAAARNTLPLLANVKITAENGEIILAATDLEIGVKIQVKGEILEPGSITAPAKKLYDIVSALPDQIGDLPATIKFTTEANDRVRLVCGSARFNVAGLPDDEFPELPDIGEEGYSINADAFCTMLSKTASSASTEQSRHFLNGVYLAAEGTHWEAVATDGKRLAIARYETEGAISESISIILPSAAVSAIVKQFAGMEELKLDVQANQLVLCGDGLTLVSRLIEGGFPDYNAVMGPSLSNEIKLRANTELLSSVLRRVSLLANPKTPQVRMAAKEGQIHVSANTPELGQAEEFMPCEIEGEIEVAFNSAFMIDILSNIETGEVTMAFKDSMSPVLVKPVEGEDYICVLMPMRV